MVQRDCLKVWCWPITAPIQTSSNLMFVEQQKQWTQLVITLASYYVKYLKGWKYFRKKALWITSLLVSSNCRFVSRDVSLCTSVLPYLRIVQHHVVRFRKGRQTGDPPTIRSENVHHCHQSASGEEIDRNHGRCGQKKISRGGPRGQKKILI